MKKIRVKYFVIGMLLILEIVSLTLMYKSSHNKEVVLDEVKLKDLIKNDMISIMTDEKGSGSYTEYTKSNTFPSTGYVYNADKSQCINEKGYIVKGVLTYDGTKVKLTSNEGMHCTLYFDKKVSLGEFCDGQANMGACIANKKSTIERVENMTSTEVGGMYRYQGTGDVNNWICFGTSDKSKCTQGGDNYGDGIDKYMYRIIGVTPDGQLALIKETYVKEETTNEFRWNNKYWTTDCGDDGSKCTWEKSTLFNRINGLCNTNNPNCSGTGEGSTGQTNIFINSETYDYLIDGNKWLNRINNYIWKYGDTNKKQDSYNGNNKYAIENAFPNSVKAKIGLQYIHDYLYAYPNGNPGGRDNAKNSWIFYQKDGFSETSHYEWLISRWGINGPGVIGLIIDEGGCDNDWPLTYTAVVRPVFYLKSDTVLKSGSTGSKNDPFIIDEIPDPISLGEYCDGQTNMGECIKNKVSTISDVTNMTSTEVGGMYRYQGTSGVHNWICFGTTDKSKCVTDMDKYMYRIIGLTANGQLKLIKQTGVKEESTTTFQWNDEADLKEASCGEGGSKCTWADSTLYNRINGLCNLNNENCQGTTAGTQGSTNIFIGNSNYEYLNSENTWIDKISNHVWKYGDITINADYNGASTYAIENKFTDSVEDTKIGLLYLHDYYLAYPGGNPGDKSKAKESWIHNSSNSDWLISRYGVKGSFISAWYILEDGTASDNGHLQYATGDVRPVFYLNSNVKINNAEGSKTDPFIITN